MSYDSQLEYPLFQTISQNGACAKWSNIFIFKYRHIIPFFSIFYAERHITLSSENVRITCYLTKKWPIFGVFSKIKF